MPLVVGQARFREQLRMALKGPKRMALKGPKKRSSEALRCGVEGLWARALDLGAPAWGFHCSSFLAVGIVFWPFWARISILEPKKELHRKVQVRMCALSFLVCWFLGSST